MSKKKHDDEERERPAEGEDRREEKSATVDEAGSKPVSDLQVERDELLARLQRVSADYLNYQKRVQREQAESHKHAIAGLIKALLPAVDDMERALESARTNHGEDDPLFKGMQLVHEKMMEVLDRFGCTVIQAAGEPFDPDLHSAIMQQPTTDYEPHTVIQELQKGYRLDGRTIRPSGVVVAVAPEAEAGEDEENGE